MRTINKTRYAVLGMLMDGPRSGYEIKSLMERSTAYFWQESDSTIYPMLKRLETEGKVLAEAEFVGKRKRVVFSITDLGREEVKEWLESPTGSETRRNEFLLKLFFVTESKELKLLLRERSEKVTKALEEYRAIEKRLEGLDDSPRKRIRLQALRYGIAQLALETKWLNEGFLPGEG